MAGRGRGKALTRPAWMDVAPSSTPQLAPLQSPSQVVNDWARATAADGRPYWYSLSTGKTSWTDPTVAGWRELKTPEGRVYYYNEVTKVTQWERPASLQQVAAVDALPEGWTAHKTPDGREYYYHKVSGETRWERPTSAVLASEAPKAIKRPATGDEGEWKAHATADGRIYYYNAVTRETSWTKPSEISERKRARIDPVVGDLRQKLLKRREEKVRRNEKVLRRPRNSEGKALSDRQAEAYFLRRAKIRGGEGTEIVVTNEVDAEAIFIQLLREKGIGANETWLEAMGRCADDSRYLAVKSYGSRKNAWLKARQKATKEERRQRIVTNRANDEAFLKLMGEVFVDEPFTATTLERCNPESVRRFESDSRFRAVDERKRANLIKCFLGVRSRKGERERKNRRRECMESMRAELDKMIDPSLVSINGTEKGQKDGQNILMVAENTKGQNASSFNPPSNGKTFFNDRTPFRELERFLINIPGSDIVSDNDRADIIREWRKHWDKLMHEKRSREREELKALQRERRASFRSGVEGMLLENRIPISAHWKDVADIVMKESFAMSEEDLDARPSDLFHDGVDLFQDTVHRHREEFKRLVKESGVEIQDSTTVEDLQKVNILNEFVKGQKESIVAALLVDRKRRESRRRQKEMQRAAEGFEEVLRHTAVNASSTYESITEMLKDRSVYKQLFALGGDAGVRRVYDEFMKKWRVSELEEAEPNRLKRKHGDPAAPIPFDHEALAALERAKRIRLPGGVPIPQVPYRPPPPPVTVPVHVEEESGWAAAVSAKPMTEKEKLEAKEKRKRELLGTLESHGQMLINGQASIKETK